MNSNFVPLGQTPEISGLIAAIRLEYKESGVSQYLRVCNWIKHTEVDQLVSINEPDLGVNQYIPYPFDLPDLSANAEKEIPGISISFPITDILLAYIQNDIEDIVGNQAWLFLTTADLLALNTNKHILFRYYIDSVSYNNNLIVFNLTVKYDINKLTIPRRKFKRNFCPWRYKDGVNCPYEPTNAWFNSVTYPNKFWTAQGTPIQNTGQGLQAADLEDKCGKTLPDCRLRQHATELAYANSANTSKRWWKLPFGGFPAIPNRDPRKF